MKNIDNQPGLFDSPEVKKEEPMEKEVKPNDQAKKVKEMSARLKFRVHGVYYQKSIT